MDAIPLQFFCPLTSRIIKSDGGVDGMMVHIVLWMEALDLRVLAVLANSTLSSSRTKKLVIVLAHDSRYLKLPTSWLVKDPTSSKFNKSLVICYDGPKVVFDDSGRDAS